jgi:DNA end-binding protein Ku
LTLQRIVDAAALDPALFDVPYFLTPDGKGVADSYAVLRDALHGLAGIGTVTFHGREHFVAVEPRGRGLAVFTLRRTNEVRAIDDLDALDEVPRKVKPAELALARKVLEGLRGPARLSDFPDTYEADLKRLLARKAEGKAVVSAPAPERPPKVVNLMDALKKSLAAVSSPGQASGEKSRARHRAASGRRPLSARATPNTRRRASA